MEANGNLFAARPGEGAGEQFFELLETAGLRLEEIVSQGATTPAGEWYDQAWPEWVALLRGEARLAFADETECILRAGDYLLIPARTRHRVAWCSADARWLALHFRAE